MLQLEALIGCQKLLIYMTGMFTHITNTVFNISTIAFSVWYGNLAQHSIKMSSKWFLGTIVAYRYYTPALWFLLQRKQLNYDSTEFTTRKSGAISDYWTRQDQKFLLSVQATNAKFSYIPNSGNALYWRIQNKFCLWNCTTTCIFLVKEKGIFLPC